MVAKLERGNDDNTAREEVRCPVRLIPFGSCLLLELSARFLGSIL